MSRRLIEFLRANQILLWMSLITLVYQLGFGLVIPVLPFFVQTFGGTEAAVGAAVAAYGLARLLFDLPMGYLTERAGRQRILLIGAAVTVIGSLFCGLATSYAELLVFRFVAGVGSATVQTVGQIVVADVSTRENRGRMMSVYMTFFQFAVGIGPVIGGMMNGALGPRSPFLAYAGLAAVAGVICLLKLPETKRRAEVGSAPTTKPESSLAVMGKLMRNPGFVLVGLVGFAATAGRTGGIFSVVPATAYRFGALTPAQVGLAFTIASLINFGTVSSAGVLADRFGRKATIVPGAALVALSFALFALQTSYLVFIVAAVFWGIGSSLSSSPSSAYAADMAPSGANGMTMGIFRTLSDLGYVIGPLVIGILADGVGPVAALFCIAALFVVVATAFLIYAPETRRKLKVLSAS